MKRFLMMMSAATVLLAGACEKPAPPAEGDTAKQAAPAEKIVEAEIPAELATEAANEITAENAEAKAAELEAEIDKELE